MSLPDEVSEALNLSRIEGATGEARAFMERIAKRAKELHDTQPPDVGGRMAELIILGAWLTARQTQRALVVRELTGQGG